MRKRQNGKIHISKVQFGKNVSESMRIEIKDFFLNYNAILMYLRILNLVCENHIHVHVHFTVISDNLSFNYKN